MKGLEVARDFFTNWGLPLLEKEFPELTKRIAAGRFDGSDVLGADDALSQDHNWGPQFTLFLSNDDFDQFAELLSQTMNSSAPSTWNGYRVDGAGDKNVIVENVSRRIERRIGFVEHPRSDTDWGIVVRHRSLGGTLLGRESALYYLKHGALWLDNNAEFRQWRKVLEHYPESVRLARLAEECFRVWQHGEYNFVERVSKRGDPLTVAIGLGEFASGVMRLMLLLHGDYTPYWKWLAHEFRKLDRSAHYTVLLEALLGSAETWEQVRLVKQICDDLHQEMLLTGVITGHNDHALSQYLSPLLNAQYELLARVPWMPGEP